MKKLLKLKKKLHNNQKDIFINYEKCNNIVCN